MPWSGYLIGNVSASARTAFAGKLKPENFQPFPSKCKLIAPAETSFPNAIANSTIFTGESRLRTVNVSEISSAANAGICAFGKPSVTTPLRRRQASKRVAIVSYDEKPGIQALATTAPDLPPEPGVHATFARDHEYKRHGTVSLLAGIDLLTGKVHAFVKDRHRSREFIEFLKLIDAAYPTHTAIKLILDNHSAHISKETRAWLAEQP